MLRGRVRRAVSTGMQHPLAPCSTRHQSVWDALCTAFYDRLNRATGRVAANTNTNTSRIGDGDAFGDGDVPAAALRPAPSVPGAPSVSAAPHPPPPVLSRRLTELPLDPQAAVRHAAEWVQAAVAAAPGPRHVLCAVPSASTGAAVDDVLPLACRDAAVVSVGSLAADVVQEFGHLAGLSRSAARPASWSPVASRLQRLKFAAMATSLPLRRFRAPNFPARYTDALFNAFNVLVHAAVTPQQYTAYADSLSPDDREVHQEIAAAYNAWWTTTLSGRLGPFSPAQATAVALAVVSDPDNAWVVQDLQRRWSHVLVCGAHALPAVDLALLSAVFRNHAGACVSGCNYAYSMSNRNDPSAWRALIAPPPPSPAPAPSLLTPLEAAVHTVLHSDTLAHTDAIDDAMVRTAEWLATVAGASAFRHTPSGACVHLSFPSPNAELDGVVRAAVTAAAACEAPPGSPPAVLVLARNARQAALLAAMLRQQAAHDAVDVHVDHDGAVPMMDVGEVKQSLAMLGAVASGPFDAQHLHLLATELYGVPPSVSARCVAARTAVPGGVLHALSRFVDADLTAGPHAYGEEATSAAQAAVGKLLAHVRELRALSATATTSAVLARFLELSGLARRLDHPHTDAETLAAEALAQLVGAAVALESSSSTAGGRQVPFMVDQLQACATALVRMPPLPPPPPSAGRTPPRIAVASLFQARDAVQCDTVFVTQCTDTQLPGAWRRRTQPVPLPMDLVGTAACPEPLTAAAFDASQRRLLAAGMATAQRRIVTSCVERPPGAGRRRVRCSRYLDAVYADCSAVAGPGAAAVAPSLSPPVDVTAALAPASSAPGTDLLPLSYSSLFDFRSCPHRYYLRKVVGAPQSSNVAMVYGSALHSAAEACGRTVQQQHAAGVAVVAPAAVAAMQQAFHDAWASGLAALPAVPFADAARLQVGATSSFTPFAERLVAAYYSPDQWRPTHVEQRFDVALDSIGVQLAGVVDRVDTNASGEGVVIKELKSGAQWRSGGGLRVDRLQLKVYAVGLQKLGLRPTSAQVESIENGSLVAAVDVTDDFVRSGLTALRDTAERINAGDLKPKPSVPVCSMCSFASACKFAAVA